MDLQTTRPAFFHRSGISLAQSNARQHLEILSAHDRVSKESTAREACARCTIMHCATAHGNAFWKNLSPRAADQVSAILAHICKSVMARKS